MTPRRANAEPRHSNPLELLYGWPETFESGSPSGGRHLWYQGAPLFAVGRANTNHPDIDFAQYIVGPGCRRADGTGYSIAKRRPIAAAPGWFYEVAKKTTRGAPVDQTPVVELDLPGNIAWAIHWLQIDAPRSIEGQGGDDTLVKKVVPPLKDMGISFELRLRAGRRLLQCRGSMPAAVATGRVRGQGQPVRQDRERLPLLHTARAWRRHAGARLRT